MEEQNSYCHVWIDGGNIILWDTWPKVFHKSWLNIKRMNKKSWQCPYCTGEWENQWSRWRNTLIINQDSNLILKGRPRKIKKISEDEEVNVENWKQSTKAMKIKPQVQCPLCNCLIHLSWTEIPLWWISKKRNKFFYVWECWVESRQIEKFIDFSERGRKNSRIVPPKPLFYDHMKKKNYLYLVKLK